MDLMLARAQISVTKIAVPKPRYIQKIIDKFVRYLLHNRNNQFVFLSQEYMFICSQWKRTPVRVDSPAERTRWFPGGKDATTRQSNI